MPEKTLLLGDAGFFSYSLAARLLAKGHAFLLRVGANKRLLTELFGEDAVVFGSDQEVWVWPQEASGGAKSRRASAAAALRLRCGCV